ncbi:hypothetical protein TSUD_269040 [Trifolium subterraneum]|uniref:TAFII28-like protein domain-containing protein n=1 Tax=Trifolium subterraneum TaxID=3900 RepID=A0A2Z6M7X1_TRISU|nr:hypothetical protein TSUD_269040 [Trifolium subterraneum]
MKQSKDPFDESPPESPIQTTDAYTENPVTKNNKDYEQEEEDIMDVDLDKFPPPPAAADLHKMSKMQFSYYSIFSQFTDEQMRRFESFRRAKFQKAKMKQLVASINRTNTVSSPISVVVSGIAKMFVGEVVETARIIMEERKESGPIRPCHLREAHRRLKLEGKAFKRTVPRRLFR